MNRWKYTNHIFNGNVSITDKTVRILTLYEIDNKYENVCKFCKLTKLTIWTNNTCLY